MDTSVKMLVLLVRMLRWLGTNTVVCISSKD